MNYTHEDAGRRKGFHIYYNWNPMMSYLKDKSLNFKIFTKEFIAEQNRVAPGDIYEKIKAVSAEQ